MFHSPHLESQKETTMENEIQDKAMFMSFCIEQYAKAKKMPTEETVNLLERYGITEHFCEFYNVLHTQGQQWLIEEIDEMINNRRNEQNTLSSHSMKVASLVCLRSSKN